MHAIHPDCAIISQLIQDQEICIQTRKREMKNQSQQTGCTNETLNYTIYHTDEKCICVCVYISAADAFMFSLAWLTKDDYVQLPCRNLTMLL